jgi:hypothetical protein
LISDSALKVVFLTTLYVDVKEPAVHYIVTTKKPNLMPTKITADLPWQVSVFRCRDKIEPNLQSQNVRRTHSRLMESRFQRDQKNTPNHRPVNGIREIFLIFYEEAIPSDSAICLLRQRHTVNAPSINAKFVT